VYVPVSQASRREPSALFRPQNTVTCPVFPVAAARPARKTEASATRARTTEAALRLDESVISYLTLLVVV
jgi:hypothetical protein